MISAFVLSAFVLVAGTGWVRGETLHPRLTPVVFKTLGECKAEERKAKILFKENKEYLKENYDVINISLKCTKKKVSG